MAETIEEGGGGDLHRKLATILAADVAGYSRLMAENEEETLRTFRGHKGIFEQLVALHRGRVFNTAGDAILAEFQSAVEAVRCATEIQAALATRNEQLPEARQVKFRIGLNLGDVVVQGSDLLGDGVNVAARLQAAAEPGGICLSGSVYDQIVNKLALSFKSLGEQSFKNIPQPVRTFSITASGEIHLPAAKKPGGARWRAVAAFILVAAVASGGYWAYGTRQARDAEPARPAPAAAPPPASNATAPQPAATATVPPMPAPALLDGTYAGPLCYGPGANDPARCFRAQGVVKDGRIEGKWSARDAEVTMLLSGDVTAAGDARMQIRGERSDGTRTITINLWGTLRDGKLDATGSFLSGRTAYLNWRREGR
jgi:class 3 adenylate cyclase